MQETTRNWVKFEYAIGYRTLRKSYSHISINKRGKIQLNSYLMEKLNFVAAVSLYYDRTTTSIGILPRERLDEDENALPIILRSDRRYGEIYALSFLRCYGIRIHNTLATNHVETTPEGMLIVDLRHAYEVSSKQ
ncbi:MAG TPA: hypothetical protein VGQ55_09635 [Pyrinomonadaceae bacterium]|nr:hypothetical protein [Pyrinomonadaceae bacterium]